jgi:putative zinc finger/helix-turn-helix YgiT family protein
MCEFAMREMNCPACHQMGKIHTGKYHYTESGLQNVWLLGVEIFECGCGEIFAFIPCAQELHKLIAQILLKQENQLSGREIRFLRKHMGMKAKDFAERLGVKNVTVSRWEQGETIPPKTIDRLIRFFYASEMNLSEIAATITRIKFKKHVKGQKESPINLPIDRIKRESCAVNA